MTVHKTTLLRHLGLFNCVQYFSAQKNSAYLLLACFVFGNSFTLFQASLFPMPMLGVAVAVLLFLSMRWPSLLPGLSLAVGLFSASLQFHHHQSSVMPTTWERKDIELIVKVVGLPIIKKEDVKFRVQVLQQHQSPELNRLISKKLQLSCYRCPLVIQAGEVWTLTVRLKRPHGYASEGAFDYEKYLFRHRIVGKGYVRVTSLNFRHDRRVVSPHVWREKIKANINESLTRVGDDRVGKNVIMALSIGDKSGFSAKQRQVLQDSGLSHLFAISGLHIGLVFFGVMFVFKHVFNLFPTAFSRFPRPYLCLIPAIPAAVLYAALAGFAVSTQRALLMLVIFVITKLLVREVSLLKVLLLAASFVLLIDAFALLDAGFWLSCGAVLVIYLASRNDTNLGLLKLQLSLWLGMAPLTVMIFGQLSVLSPVLNLMAVPLFCLFLIPATLFGVLLNEIGLTLVARPLLTLLESFYRAVFSFLEWVTAYSYSSLVIPSVEPVIWGSLLCVMVVLWVSFPRTPSVIFVSVVLILSGLILFLNHSQENAQSSLQRLKITLLDVGQGLSLVIQTQGYVIVYDTGPRYSSGFTAAEAVLLPYLRSEGIDKVDKLIISHADNDHIGGYTVLSNAVRIDNVLTSRIDKLPNAIECEAGQHWRQGDTHFSILSPDEHTPKGSNNRSCVLKVEHQGTSILITGDIEKQVERYLISRGAALKATVMLVPHQGSKTSSTATFLDVVKPKLALVAAGYLNHYGHPDSAVLKRYSDRGITVVSTVDSGSIEVVVENGHVQVNRFRHSSQRIWHWGGG